jgi:signal transduction histidine kinase
MLGFTPSLRLSPGLSGKVSPEIAEHALAVVREGLSNAARHSGASQVEVTVDVETDEMLVVQVTDNGSGLPEGGRRSGLRNLAGRAEMLGGELRLGAADPGAPAPGTRLEWRVPAMERQLRTGIPGGGPGTAPERRGQPAWTRTGSP